METRKRAAEGEMSSLHTTKDKWMGKDIKWGIKLVED